jgi:predicted ATPase
MPGTSNNFIVTGTSGTGKTSLIEHLRERGFTVFNEPVRQILTEQLSFDGPGLPSKDPALFLELMLDYCVRSLEATVGSGHRPTFFDRGIPDIAAYAIRFGVNPARFYQAAREQAYNTHVFVLPPWREIFVSDELRRKTFDEYLGFHDLILEAYRHVGYNLIDVPLAPVYDRAEFVLREMKKLQT